MPITSAKKKGERKENLVVALLGATRGSRMGNYGAKFNIVLPNGQTLLHHQVDLINRSWGPSEILISAGYDADRVIAKKPQHTRIVENNRWQETGEVEELRLILNCCEPEHLIIFCGDVFASSMNLGTISIGQSWSLSLSGNDVDQIGIKEENGYLDMFSFSFTSKFLGVLNFTYNDLILLRKFINREHSKFALWELIDNYIKEYKLKNINMDTHKIIKLNTAKDLGLIRNSMGNL